jgi:hypothetical protein
MEVKKKKRAGKKTAKDWKDIEAEIMRNRNNRLKNVIDSLEDRLKYGDFQNTTRYVSPPPSSEKKKKKKKRKKSNKVSKEE